MTTTYQNFNILIVAINARFSHTSLAARSLVANSQALQPSLLECEIKQEPENIVRKILAYQPDILAIGVYIWNQPIVEHIIPMIRDASPHTKIIVGGPEVSYDTDSPVAQHADHVLCGECELIFPDVCSKIASGDTVPHIIYATPPMLSDLYLPGKEYTDSDIANRNIYIETSRGCPCNCAFCLSSLQKGVRYYPLENVFTFLDDLCSRGAKSFRFVDRSFNLAGARSVQILNYFLQKEIKGLFLHLEVVPEIMPAAFRGAVKAFPPGCLHIETGIQSLNPSVLKRVHRIAKPDAALEGIHWLTHEAKATVHADLIAGLPGEDLSSFANGLQMLYQHSPAEIQLGTLKHLPGTHLDDIAGMRFAKEPPYEVIHSDMMSPTDILRIKRFAAHWERVMNRNLFPKATRLLLDGQDIWSTFDAFSQDLASKHGQFGIGLVEIARALYDHLTTHTSYPQHDIRCALREDYLCDGKRINPPGFLSVAPN